MVCKLIEVFVKMTSLCGYTIYWMVHAWNAKKKWCYFKINFSCIVHENGKLI